MSKNLVRVTLTGADDTVNPENLNALSGRFPRVEWAILSSQKREGKSRYPTESWVARFHEACPNVRKAIHLCGEDVDAFLAWDARVHAKVAKFDRVQLNFNQHRTPKELGALVRVACEVLPIPNVILQHNSANANLWAGLHHQIPNLNMLFDSSGGSGQSPKNGWHEMLPHTLCGFAGGLGPDNIVQELAEISRIADGRGFWIDMESKLRSPIDDSFDLSACEAVLKHAYQD